MAGRPSTGPPEAVIRDSRTVNLLVETMRRAKPKAIAISLQLQLKALVRLALSNRRRAIVAISPTNKELRQSAGCGARQARNNMRTLEEWGALIRLQEGGGTEAATYAFEGEALFRKLVELGCNPGKDLRNGLRPIETHRFQPAVPPAVTPPVEPTLTPAVRSTFSVLDQRDNFCENTFASHLEHTTAVKAGFSSLNQCDNGNENSLCPIYETLAWAELQACSVSPCQEIAGEVSIHAEALASKTKPLPCYPRENTHKPPPAAAERPLDATAVPSADRTWLTPDAALMLEQLRQNGPSTYGVCASTLGWGATRAWQVAAELVALCIVRHDTLGRIVVIAEHKTASEEVLPFAFGARANA